MKVKLKEEGHVKKQTINNMSTLNEWIFHFNPHRKVWEAATRSNYNQIFSGGEDVLRSSKIETLVEIVNKTDGDKDKIEELLHQKYRNHGE